ncbi:hypothetical protein [Noviherbaspirillum malthae]|uniref:hypothetical protein n=1 Tax=Noviherbaspirillum malthae TaxID=1260987 RepID=UPI00188F72AC|nr:hypothetical protein [Noviherbaspirillum malthae]
MNIKINPASAGLNWLPKPAAGPRPDLSPAKDLAVQPALAEVPAPAAADESALSAASLFQPLIRGLGEWSRGVSGAANEASSAQQGSGAQANGRPDYAGSFSLTVKTRDGDTVTLHFDEARTHGPQTSQSNAAAYRVEGNLSESERAARDKVVAKMTDIADSFFSDTVGFGRLVVMDDLGFFDAGELAGFALNVSQDRQFQGGNAERAYSSLSFSYETDLEAKTQRLSSEMLDGYQQKDGAGMHRYAYDLTSSISSASKALLNGMDVRELGRPGVYQSAPTALPAYYQGALQALAGNIDRLAALTEDADAQAAGLADAKSVSDLFRGLAANHPAYKNAAEPVQAGLNRMFDLLPPLMKQANELLASFLNGSLQVKA